MFRCDNGSSSLSGIIPDNTTCQFLFIPSNQERPELEPSDGLVQCLAVKTFGKYLEVKKAAKNQICLRYFFRAFFGQEQEP